MRELAYNELEEVSGGNPLAWLIVKGVLYVGGMAVTAIGGAYVAYKSMQATAPLQPAPSSGVPSGMPHPSAMTPQQMADYEYYIFGNPNVSIEQYHQWVDVAEMYGF
ncbi:MAG: hypothetical protein GX654_22410 [Desulfatiglans sp.]|nr:hypothetical protein [Desulfatiglans sp.]